MNHLGIEVNDDYFVAAPVLTGSTHMRIGLLLYFLILLCLRQQADEHIVQSSSVISFAFFTLATTPPCTRTPGGWINAHVPE